MQAERRLLLAEEEVQLSKAAAALAREDAMREAEIAAEAKDENYEWTVQLLEKRVQRAEARMEKTCTLAKVPESRTPEQWAALKADAAKKAQHRERMAIGAFLD